MTQFAEPSVRRRRRVGWIALPVAFVVLGLIGVLATRPDAATSVAPSRLVGKIAPNASGLTIDGSPADLQSLRGSWVVVNFFATWCVPCRQEHPSLVAFDEQHRAGGDAAVFGVVYADDFDAVRQFRSDEGGEWPMLTDPDGRIALDYGMSGVPESFLINPAGVIVAKIVRGVRVAPLNQLLMDAKAKPSPKQ